MNAEAITRCGNVTVRRGTDPTGRPVVRAEVDVTEWTHTLVGQLAELWEQDPGALTGKLSEYLARRADEIEHAEVASIVRDAQDQQRDVIDQLLELANVAPAPSVLLGTHEVAAIARVHLDASLTASPLVDGAWPETADVHPFGEPERAA